MNPANAHSAPDSPSPAAGAEHSPRVSVLMCAYNTAQFVEAAVRSVLEQTFRDFEVLLFDDGSTDDTPQILEKLAAEDSRIRLHFRPHGNYCEHFNEGLALARGEYIARADADDLNEPIRFERQVAVLDAAPEVVAVGSRVREIDPYGVDLGVTGEDDQPSEHAAIEQRLLLGNGWAMSHPAAMIRATAMREVGGYRPEFLFAEDTDLFLRLAEVGKLANVPEPLIQYRRHARSVGQEHFQTQRGRFRRALEQAHARRGLTMPSEPEFFKVARIPTSQRLEQWVWNALRVGRVDVARQHAFKRLRLHPLSPRGWKLCLCALRGW